MAAPRRPTARVEALPARRSLADFGRLAPSGASIALGLALLALAVGGYVGARETSVFSLERVEVRGGTPRARAAVRHALAPELGRSLLRIDADVVHRRLGAVPEVRSATFDRDFPHTLRIVVAPERPVLLLRRGAEGWVVSARGRVLRKVRNTRLSRLPRVWVPPDASIRVGAILAGEEGAAAAAALAPAAASRFPGRVRFVRTGTKELTFVLFSGSEVRLGDVGDLRLKLAVARRILGALTETGPVYTDVSVPERPVVGSLEAQVESRGRGL